MSAPLVTVIVVCRNPGPLLHTALESAWAQHGVACELVVVDGGSTDGTREWLEAQRTRLSALVSEPDRGVYDAMNKGIAAARGEWVLFLGADDRLMDGALATSALMLSQTDAGVVAGEAIFDDGRIYRLGAVPAAVRRNFVHHQAAFYRRTLFTAHHGFDDRLQLQGDYDFNLRVLKSGIPFVALPVRVAACGSGGLSDSGRWANYHEEIIVRHRHFPGWQCWLWDLGSMVRYLRKQALRSQAKHRPE